MLDAVLSAVRQWLPRIQETYARQITAMVQQDTAACLRVRIESERYLGEIHISEPDFRPYRYAAFLLLDREQAADQPPAYVYYDSEHDTAADVLEGLNHGIAVMISDTDGQNGKETT